MSRGIIDKSQEHALVEQLRHVPSLVSTALETDLEVADLATKLAQARDIIFLGRGIYYPIALEGALKLKEISYIHAEGYASGELKHGPIALIDEHTPVVFLAPYDTLFEKSLSNLEEVAARKGVVYLISDKIGAAAARGSPARFSQCIE